MERTFNRGGHPDRPEEGGFGRSGSSRSQKQPWPQRSSGMFKLGKLQIAAILLIIVFVWGVVSAVAIAMYEIDPPAQTEFQDDGKADVYGSVYDEDGHSLENVTVALLGTHHFTRTNPEGFYSMENIKEGDYRLEASLDDYSTVTKRVTLYDHKPNTFNFYLKENGNDKTENEMYESYLSDLKSLNLSTAILILVYGSVALIGGIFAFFQRFYWIAMLGGVCGIFAGLFSIGVVVGPILGIIALFLIVTNHEEFQTTEIPFFDRIRGVSRAEPSVSGVSKEGTKKLKPYGMAAKPKVKLAKPRPDEMGYTRPIAAPPEQMYPPETQAPREKIIGGPALTCEACKGTVKSESQGTVCQCGASYHKFCANSISVCKRCGAPL